MTNILLVTIALLTVLVACEQNPDLDLDLQNKTGPSFTLSGRSLALEFEVLEVPRTKPLRKTSAFSYTGQIIWRVSSNNKIQAAAWPPLTYGETPGGFRQITPEHGKPPLLSEKKLYVARLVGENDFKSALFFEIRKGKAINVTDEIFGQ